MNTIAIDPFEEFKKISEIGKGSCSRVYRVRNIQNNKEYALKHLNGELDSSDIVATEFYQSALSPCPNIVQSYALYHYDDEYFILQELMSMNLGTFIAKNNVLPERVAIYILKEIIKGIHYIHSHNQIHRDIKSENIFIDALGNVKIGDFGSSAILTQEKYLRTTIVGSPL